MIKDVKSLNLATCSSQKASFRLNPSVQTQSLTALSNTAEYFEFIGACVKLEKSNLSSSNFSNFSKNTKKHNFKVNFKDVAETFEYPSYEFLLKEMGIDPSTDPDYQIVPNDNSPSLISFNSFLPGSADLSSNEYESTDYYDNHETPVFYSNQTENLENIESNDFDISGAKFSKGFFC